MWCWWERWFLYLFTHAKKWRCVFPILSPKKDLVSLCLQMSNLVKSCDVDNEILIWVHQVITVIKRIGRLQTRMLLLPPYFVPNAALAFGPLHLFHSQQMILTSISYRFTKVSCQVWMKLALHVGSVGTTSWCSTVPFANRTSTQCVYKPPLSCKSSTELIGRRIHPGQSLTLLSKASHL